MPSWNIHFTTIVRTDDPTLVKCLADAHALARVIRGIPIPPHVQRRLDSLNIMRAVRGTTGIEGTELTEEEVEKILEAPPEHRALPEGRSREEMEVRNANRLMHSVAQVLRRNPDTPITEDLVRTFHHTITQGIDYPKNIPGQYRTHRLHAGTYQPPVTGDEVERLMAEFIEWFNTGAPRAWDPIIRAIVAHFYVISIHPFGDGNGRTSRAIESYLLYQAGVNARGYYSLANFYYRKRSEYVSMLDYVRFRSDPDLTPFVTFALEGLVEELEAVHEEVLSEVLIIAFRDFALWILSTQNKLGTLVGRRLLLFLLGLGKEPVSLRALRAGSHKLSGLYKGVTSKTLMRDINFLREHSLVVVHGDLLEANLAVMTQFTVIEAPDPVQSSMAVPV